MQDGLCRLRRQRGRRLFELCRQLSQDVGGQREQIGSSLRGNRIRDRPRVIQLPADRTFRPRILFDFRPERHAVHDFGHADDCPRGENRGVPLRAADPAEDRLYILLVGTRMDRNQPAVVRRPAAVLNALRPLTNSPGPRLADGKAAQPTRRGTRQAVWLHRGGLFFRAEIRPAGFRRSCFHSCCSNAGREQASRGGWRDRGEG